MQPAASTSSARAASDSFMTYSIVARDAMTGELGVAVQSHYFQVGTVVPWAEAGVGAVATQALADIRYGAVGLTLLRAGYGVERALAALRDADPTPEARQVGMVDHQGEVAAFTGPKCIPEFGHVLGEQFSTQANLAARKTVPDAMAAAFRSATGRLAERLVMALEAGEAEGGDIRGRQSAALLVVSGTDGKEPWAGRLVDLRVDDHPDPLTELARLLRLKRATMEMAEVDAAGRRGDVAAVVAATDRALALAPELVEIQVRAALATATTGDVARGAALLGRVLDAHPHWREPMRRLALSRFPPAVLADLEAALAARKGER